MNKKEKSGSHSQQQAKQFMEHGKVPPQAIDLEEAVLGACMLERDAFSEIGHILTAECFYKETHQKIFIAIESLAARTEPIDLMTITNQLRNTGELEMVGGAFYITSLTMRIASTANIQFHAYVIYQKHIQREMISACSNLILVSYDDSAFDEVEANYHILTEKMDDLLAGRKSDRSMSEILKDYVVELDRRAELSKDGDMTGIKTGIVSLNKMTNGWKPGELIIVAGRPGMGKTAVALNLFAKKAAESNKRALFFSLEMDELSLTDRLVCSYGGIDPDRLKSGKLTKEEWNTFHGTAEKLQKLPMRIDDSANVSIKHVASVSRAKTRKGLCDIVFIDYLQLIEQSSTNNNWNKNREREVAEMSRSLKLLAKELKIPVVLLCQLSRAVETRNTTNKRPQLSDLRESGAIEQDADMVIFPYRPEYYGLETDDQGTSLKGVMLLIVAKNRQGRVGDVLANYSPDLTQFFDYNHEKHAF